MRDLSLKRRSRLRSKETKRIIEWIKDEWGIQICPKELESGSLDGKEAYVLNGKIIGMEEKGGFMLTLRGVMELKPTRRWVTVDMGAVRFLANGADVMAPGILETDPGIETNDLVWVRDEKNGRPLCIGRALIPGSDMKGADSGKAVRTIHFVGDPIWNASV